MLKIKEKSATAASTDLNVNLNKLTNSPLYYLDSALIADVGIEEGNIDDTFTNGIYDTDANDRFVDIVNALPLLYGFKVRLIYDKVLSNYFLTYDPDYVPLVNTNNRSVTISKLDVSGKKNIIKTHIRGKLYDGLSHELLGGEDNDVVIPEPNTTDATQTNYLSTNDFKLLRLNLRGILNPLKTRLRVDDGNTTATYVETNEIYMLGVDKKKAFGDTTAIHVHQILPKTLNKFSVEYIGTIADLDYVYFPIQF